MKRICTFFLAVVMLVSLLPVASFAAEVQSSEHERLIELACEVFPEFEQDLRNESSQICLYSADESNAIVYEDTRSVSETESVTLAKTARGAIVVVQSVSEMNISYDLDPTNSSHGVSGTVTFYVTTNSGSGTFKLANVCFEISYTGSDSFVSFGTPSKTNGFYTVSYNKVLASAYNIRYALTFASGSVKLIYELKIGIANNQITASILV